MLITPSRKYSVLIEADARLTINTTFYIEQHNLCFSNPIPIPISLLLMVIFVVVLFSYVMRKDGKKDEKSQFYKRNLTKGTKLSLDEASGGKVNTNRDKNEIVEGKNDKTLEFP